jgi:hypothetical protein
MPTTLTIADEFAASLKPGCKTGNPKLEGLTNGRGNRTDAPVGHGRACSAAE